jgi:predicted ester cyclase
VVDDPQFPEPLKGAHAITKDIGDWFGAFPDIETRITRTVVNGTSFAVEWSMSGSHKGPLVMPDGHVPATGKPVRMVVVTIGRLDAEGRIAEERRSYDLASVMGQLGLMQ